jgi:hypothetical protein
MTPSHPVARATDIKTSGPGRHNQKPTVRKRSIMRGTPRTPMPRRVCKARTNAPSPCPTASDINGNPLKP